ncbi:Uncharacterised protein [Salmonella enterica subsp. enterica serovar Typhimurium str. DT104]|nr:Uncharacterised protein [Salmonella enterica subsp. enterica serovar Typhimurium str. DT104]CNR85053.1 Uncharacterised protein [Salmonella enterica subsp. enterica serovar Typhimurium str. DT104]
MEKLINSLSKAKKQLKKLKYIEVNIKSRCSIRNIVEHEVQLLFNCDYEYYYENFLLYYLSNGFYPNPIERIISLNYKQEDYIYNLKLEDITKSAFFSKRLNNFHFYNDIRCLIGG